MHHLLLLFSFFALKSCQPSPATQPPTFADNVVIAHRGAWKANQLPQNSIASLKHAIALQCTGSEFDIRMTADEVLIVTHDADYHDLVIEESTYDELARFPLPNGETLPTLRDMLMAGMTDNPTTGMVCEIKPATTKARSLQMADQVVALVKELAAEDYVASYISFSYDILQRINEIAPEAKTLYLDGSLAPAVIHQDGISGLDYGVYRWKKRPQWIQEAQKLGLILNAWTANKEADIDWLLAHQFDYITTDEPELVFARMEQLVTPQEWQLVWSDEFEYEGQPDPAKWSAEIGFKRNQEKQYYTDQLKNARVTNGQLILESHLEKIPNATFTSADDKNWRNNRAFAQYTAASLTTKNLAEWQYGRIDIKAQLPEGVGLWPAFWMIGENYDEVGWPECGEIDIMEHVGFEPDSIFGTIHTKAYNHMRGTQKGKKAYVAQPYDSFHTYSLVWTPEYMDFMLDGMVYNHIQNEHKTTHEWPFDQPFHLKINVAIGGMLGGRKGIDDASFPNQMIIDYVRVYQKEP